jgi:glutamate dehydrogenase/leucine dehydrogenase
MSLKTAAVGLPLGGGKGGVAINPKNLSNKQLEELSRKYVAHLAPHIGPSKDIPAPDMNTNAIIIDWMVDEFEKQTGDSSKASFTGKSIGNKGSEGREAATGLGGIFALREVLNSLNLDKNGLTIGIQGFGNVGLFFGTQIQENLPKLVLTAASDSSGGVASAFGLDIHALADFKLSGNKLIDYVSNDSYELGVDGILYEEVDVLVLAALGDVITKDNMSKVRAKIILELANAPVSEEAYNYLTSKEITIIPDVLANAGGVIVSYLEWLQNQANEHWPEEKVNQKLEAYMVSAVNEALGYASKHNMSLKESAFALGIRRILGAKKG